ncbi:MAG TPA: hypothetical protein PLF42_16455, partial [Anaerolineales bacterium]|nr:hypothetical protein [Anaerolineales bacterium]
MANQELVDWFTVSNPLRSMKKDSSPSGEAGRGPPRFPGEFAQDIDGGLELVIGKSGIGRLVH